jgi:hypothetical protein
MLIKAQKQAGGFAFPPTQKFFTGVLAGPASTLFLTLPMETKNEYFETLTLDFNTISEWSMIISVSLDTNYSFLVYKKK